MLLTTIQPPCQATAIIQNVQSGQSKKILTALRSTIILNSQGVNTNQLNPTIIKEVIEYFSTNSTKKGNQENINSIRKSFYLFLEMIPKTDTNGKILAEFFLLTNQIRKDLEHPNEFFRAIVMNTLAKIIYTDETSKKALIECFEPLHQPIMKNLRHMHFYTRRNALIAYFNGFNPEIDEISDMMKKENNAQLLRLCFTCLEKLDGPKVEFEENQIRIGTITYDLKSIPDDLLIDIMRTSTSENLFKSCISFGKSRPIAYFLLLQNFNDFPINMVPSFLEILNEPSLKEIGLKVIKNNLHKISGALSVSQLIPLLDCDCKEVLFQIIDSVKKPIDREIIKKKLREEIQRDYFDEDYLVFILEKYAELVELPGKIAIQKNTSDLQTIHIQNKLKMLAVGDNPRTAFSALPLCDNLINILPNIKFGKVFRKAVNIIVSDKENHEKLINLCKKGDFCSNQVGNFGILAMALFKIAFLDQSKDKKQFKDQILEILVKMMEIGKDDINFDYTTYEIVSQIFNDISSKNLVLDDQEIPQEEKKPQNKKMLFPFLKRSKSTEEVVENETRRIVRQLSGYTDPLYVEAFVNVTRLKITVELLIINTTSHMITNIIPEFTISSNITGDRSYSFNLDKQSIIKREYSFKVNEVVNGFLTGYVQFSIGKKMNMSISLGEIQFKVNEYLLEKKISQDDFKGSWLTLEWENSYTSRFRCSLEVDRVFERIKNELKCTVIDKIVSDPVPDNKSVNFTDSTDEKFIVANLCCTTLLAEDILLNLKISKENTAVSVDCRMRSASEQIVKSLSVVFGECLRGIKE